MIYLDTETCGFHGMAVLLQWAEDEGPVHRHNIWKRPVIETLELIQMIVDNEVCGFNLAFDWFHLCKIYTIFSLLPPMVEPQDIINQVAEVEPEGRFGPCLKPKAALDLMLLSRKTKFQTLMDRSDIKIRRIPSVLAPLVAAELEERVKIDDIYFAKRKDKFAPKWQICDVRRNGKLDTNFKDIVLRFRPGGGLKNLALYALGIKEDAILSLNDIGIPDKFRPVEVGYAPFAKALAGKNNWKGTWPDVIQHHIDYWAFNSLGIKYAENDVLYTRGLRHFFSDPVAGDIDSNLACMVGAVRWHGYKINIDKIRLLREKALKDSHLAPKDPNRAKAYLLPFLSETEKLALLDSQGNTTTKKAYLESIARWKDNNGNKHPAAIKAQMILDARKAKKEVELYDKLLLAGRFHASFVVVGTLSTRMAGADGLNAQGINHRVEVRDCFPLADDEYILCGGDFESFEVVLADAAYNDPVLRNDLKSGKKIHALFAMELYPGKTYDEIMASKGTKDDMYGKGKNGVFSQIYGGDENTLKNKLSIDIEIATQAMQSFQRKYRGVGIARKRIFDKFCSMRQPKGIGTNVEWHDPADYIESLLGFRRYFTLENQIVKALYQLASKPPKSWKGIKVNVQRRDRIQSAAGAAMSALYGAAFQIQAANMRAAANHEIQCTGGEITKNVQANVWSIQPTGINEWIVIPMQVHDELMTPTKPDYLNKVHAKVNETVEFYRGKVPLIEIDWHDKMNSWADK